MWRRRVILHGSCSFTTLGNLFERKSDLRQVLYLFEYASLLREVHFMLVYILNKNGSPLMPCEPKIARKLLCQSKAKVVSRIPFTIKLLYGSGGYKQAVVAKIDAGSKKMGAAALANDRVIYQAEVEIRNDIKSKMEQRRMYRRTRRNRKTRYREARFNNRGKMGKLAPSIQSKVQSHLREKKFIESILPVSSWLVETAQFDIHKISNPKVSRFTYQKGRQKDFYNVKAYILHRDSYACQYCKANKVALHVHHIKFRSEGGSDTPDNLITLCHQCHDSLHAKKSNKTISEKLLKKIPSKTKHATEIGIVSSQIKKKWAFTEAFGYETKFNRENLNLPKTHYNDAVAIGLADNQIIEPSNIVYFKKHVSMGDYQQTSGARSEKTIPTGKLFGLRKFDLIETSKGVGFVKGKRSSGYFALMLIDGTNVTASVNVKKNCKRMAARKTTLIWRTRLLPDLKVRVSAA